MPRRKPAATRRKPKARSGRIAGARASPDTNLAGAGRPGPDQATGPSEPVEPEALVITHWFESGIDGEPYSATIRLTGRRVGVPGPASAADTFTKAEVIDGIVPGSGPVSITSWVYGLQPGDWSVTADMTRSDSRTADQPSDHRRRSSTERLAQAHWSWRSRRLTDGHAASVTTRWALLAPMARIPAVVPGSFTLMGTLAIITALVVQSVLLARENVPVDRSLLVSLLAVVVGLIGAKLWYAVLHPGAWRQALGGWSVDGFLIAAPLVSIVALVALDLPIGAFLDAAAPGIFVAVGIGRFGCFFTGCCAGRCTRSRFGVWSSDRRIGARRIPAQLLESAAGLVIGLVATAVLIATTPGLGGLIFVAAVAAYILARQLLLRIRAERREFSWRRSRLVSGGGS